MRKDQELLLQAAREGDSAVVRRILVHRRSGPLASLRRGPGANVQDSTGFTPLHHAALNGHTEIVSLLLAADASPFIKDGKGATPLHLAAWNGHEDIVAMLLTHHPLKDDLDVDIRVFVAKNYIYISHRHSQANSGDTPLHYSAQFGHTGAVIQLLKRNADPQAKNNKHETPLDLAAQFGRFDVVEKLIRHSPGIVDPFKASRHRGMLFPSTPLHRASNNGHGSVVMILLKAGVDPNCRTAQGTALHVAATFGKLDAARALLERGADPRIPDSAGRNVIDLLSTLPEKLAMNMEMLIHKYSTVKGLVECLPPIPIMDSPDYEHAVPIGAYERNGTERLQTDGNSMKLSNIASSRSIYKKPQKFVKKIATKYFGVKFNSAPNISQHGLESEIGGKCIPKSPTLSIGNSRFFNFKSKSNETTVICNDEFDTISLDGFMFDRSNQGNSSNRSFPGGLKNSLPNILEKPEDDVLSDASQESSSSFENITAIYHPDKHSNQELHFETIIETELESLEARDEDESNLEEKPTNQVVLNNKEDARQYVNVTIQKIIARPAPVPAARSNVPLPKPDIVNIDRESKLYENIVIKEAVKPEPAKRTIKPDGTAEDLIPTVVPTPKPKIMAPSLSFESNDSDEENFEDLMMSKKSSSFSKRRKPTNWTFMEKTKTKQIERTKSMKSESSTTTEVLTLEDVDCSSDISTLAYKRQSSTLPRSSFYSEKTLTPQAEFRTLPRSIPREISENYHIKGTGKCIYQGPTLNEFMNAMNRDTLRPETLNNRFSYSAICFCRPVNPIKHSKSEGDLLENVEIDNVNLDSYLNSLRNSLNSFKCYCDVDYSCSLNHKRAGQFAVYYSAAKRSYSFPNLTDLATKVDIDLITASTENDTSLTFGALSDTSTLRSLDSNTLDSKRSVIFDDDTIGNKRSAKSRPTVDPSVQIGLAELYTKSLANDKAQSELSGPVEVEIVTDVSGSVHSCGYGRDSDEFSLSSAASSHHQDCNKVSPTPPKKPPRRNLSVSPTHVNVQPTSPCYNNSYEHMNKSAAHARSQDDLDDIQANKHYFKLGTSVDHCIDSKYFADYEQRSTKPVPNPRPSLKQPVAISAMYENVVIKEQNPKRKLRRNYENFEPRRFSIEDPYSQGDRVEVPSSPTHYEQPPTPEHPPPSAVQAERCIHERIRPLSQEYKRRSCGYGLRDSWTETERWLMRDSWADDQNTGSRDSWSETRANTYDSWSDEQRGVLRTGSSNSLASSATTDNAIDEYVAAAPFGGLFKGSTTQLESAGLKPMPAERPRTLRKLRNVYEPADVDTEIPTAMDVSVRRRTNSNQSVGDKSLSILSPFDEQEEWAKISKIMESIGTKLVRESVFVSELEQEFQSRLGLSCSDTSLSPSIASSIGHWLYGVGLVEYETVFQTHGYDDLDFINGLLDATDLREMGVREEEHQKILDAITHLPQKIADVIHVQNKNKYEEQNTSVDEWLRQINLDQYSETFRKHLYLDMERVRNIWEVELTAVLEIQKFGHRKRILRSVSGENNGPAQRIEDTIDLNNIKNNIQSLKENHREKTPEPQTKPLPILNIPTMGTETLKRSKKNRPAPQPPKPSDLEIRAPSELLVGVPGALETKWRHKPFVLVTGAVTYVANYLGSTVVKELRGTESTKKSIQKLKRSTKEPRDSPDIILSISYRGVKFLNTITKELVCEHEIRNIHCACQDADDLTHFAYITKDLISKCHYCHVFRVATMDQATEVILTLGEAFEVAYQMALREAQLAKAVPKVTKTPTHEPKERNHGRSHSITEIKLNGHQLKIAPIPSSLSNEDFQYSKDGSKGLSYSIKAPIASTEEL